MRLVGRAALGVFVLVLVLAGCTRTEVAKVKQSTSYAWPVRPSSTQDVSVALVRAADEQLTLELVDSPEERQRGLGYRDEVQGDGMLFLFDTDEPQPFWMKGMRFDLDIVWFYRGRVIAIEQNVPAADQADASPPLYGPEVQVDAVIELTAGRTAELGLTNGSQVDILELRK